MNYSSAQQVSTVRNIARTAQQQIKNKTGMGMTMLVYPTETNSKTPEQMLTVIAMALDMAPETFRLRSRERNVVELRFIGALFLRMSFPLITLQQIAALFGGQDHSSIISGLSRAKDLISCGDQRFVQKYNIILRTINLWVRENS